MLLKFSSVPEDILNSSYNVSVNSGYYRIDKMISKRSNSFLFFLCYCGLVYSMNLGSLRQNQCTLNETCVPLTRCDSYLSAIKSLGKPLKPPIVQFLRNKQCGFEDGYPKICCPNLPKDDNTTTSKTDAKNCSSEINCTGLKDCQPYLEFIGKMQKPLNSFVVEFLRSQQCGFREGYPMVCCAAIPKGLEVLGQAVSDISKERNKLSSTEQDFSEIFSKTETTTSPSKLVRDKNIKAKSEAFNRYFADYFDLSDPFDLVFKRKK